MRLNVINQTRVSNGVIMTFETQIVVLRFNMFLHLNSSLVVISIIVFYFMIMTQLTYPFSY